MRLESIVIPTQISECKNIHCQDKTCLAAIDWFAAEVLEGLQDSAEETLPKSKGGDKEISIVFSSRNAKDQRQPLRNPNSLMPA